MAVRRIGDETEILAGHYVCASRGPAWHCTEPRLITKIQGTRLHFMQEGKATYMYRKDALYLCDTKEDGDKLFDLLYERSTAVDKAQQLAWQAVIDEYAPKLKSMMVPSINTGN